MTHDDQQIEDSGVISDKGKLLIALQVLCQNEPDRSEDHITGTDVADDILFLIGMNAQPKDFASPITDDGKLNQDAKDALYVLIERALNELIAYRMIENIG